MPAALKAGDRVERLNDMNSWFDVGQHGTITRIYTSNGGSTHADVLVDKTNKVSKGNALMNLELLGGSAAEEKMELKIGDMVEVIEDISSSSPSVKKGMRGVVCDFSSTSTSSHGIDFGKDIGGHTCGGKCKNGFGYYCTERHLQLIKPEGAKPIKGKIAVGSLIIAARKKGKDWHFAGGMPDGMTYIVDKIDGDSIIAGGFAFHKSECKLAKKSADSFVYKLASSSSLSCVYHTKEACVEAGTKNLNFANCMSMTVYKLTPAEIYSANIKQEKLLED